MNLNGTAQKTKSLSLIAGLLIALPIAAGLTRAGDAQTPRLEAPKEDKKRKTYYRESRSTGTKRETDPPKYVRHAPDTGIGFLKDAAWLDIGLDHRLRAEHRDDDARRPSAVLDQPILFKTRAYIGIHDILDPFRFAIELQDSRRENSQFPRDDRDVNQFGIIQSYAELYFDDAFGEDPLGNARPLSLRAGRMWLEMLDRRLIANNQWRNTTNTFQGFRATIGQEANDWQLDLLAVQPLVRQKYDLDQPREGQWLYAAIGHWRGWSDSITLEPYFLSLHQHAQQGLPERSIHSAALRGYGLIGSTAFDYDFDAVYQFGRNGSERHRAFGFTGELGYTFAHPWKPRLSAFYGYASGDADPNDRTNQRFERYFGFGRPWSSNDYITWENLHAPKARLEFQPHKKLRIDAGYNLYWLASETDRWANANLRDRSGRSGSFIGHEFDARGRYAFSSRVEATLGYAHFHPGGFARATGKPNDTDFVYLELTFNALP